MNSPFASPDISGVLTPHVPVDVKSTIEPLQRSNIDSGTIHFADPTVRYIRGAGLWLAFNHLLPDNSYVPVSVHIEEVSPYRPEPISYRIFTAGNTEAAEAVEASLPRFLGIDDDAVASAQEFGELLHSTAHLLPHKLLQAHRENPGLRLPATGRVSTELITVILEQKVDNSLARSMWRNFVKTHGTPAIGPVPEEMFVPPTPQQTASIPSWDLQVLLFEPFQIKAVAEVAKRARSIERIAATSEVTELAARLQSIPGIGAWSVAETLQRTHGATDLVSVGDYNLAHLVGEVFTGKRVDDAGMLELLEPWAGHRQRIIRLIFAAGFRKQRFSHRSSLKELWGRRRY